MTQRSTGNTKLYIIVYKRINGKNKVLKFKPSMVNNHGRCMDFNTKNIKRGIR